MVIAKYTLAMGGRGRGNQNSSARQQTADFIDCVTFNRAAEFAEKYFRQGMWAFVSGRTQIGNYVNKEGQKIYITEVILDDQEFADSKGAASRMGGYAQTAPSQRPAPTSVIGDRLMNTPDGVENEGLPSNQDIPWLVIKENDINGI